MLVHKKYIKYVLGIVIVLLISVITVLLLPKEKPIDIVERKLDINLPNSTEVVDFTYLKDDGFGAKMLIDKQCVEQVKNELNTFLSRG